MGQKCCSATEASPQINIQEEESTYAQPTFSASPSDPSPNNKQHLEKRQFYGKDGEVHSRTITKDMAVPIDANFEQYKQCIFKQQSTIREETEESCDSHTPAKRHNESSHYTEVFQNFLDNMAEEVSGRA